MADKLAKEAFAKKSPSENSPMNEPDQTRNVGIFVNPTELEDIIKNTGTQMWDDFRFISLEERGKVNKCNFTVNGKLCSLNFHSKNNGTTTMSPTGKNTELSLALKERIIELSDFKDTGVSKSHTFRINKEWSYNLVGFLGELEDIEKDCIQHENPKYEQCKFVSAKGDRLNINIYETGNVVLQGKPAYLYTEALSFLSYCPQISMTDVIEANNSFHEVDIKVEDTRTELQKLMPNAYGNIDDTLFKILSPAISLKKVNVEMEDYSCYAFPALRALEGYLKYLFSIEEIEIGHSYGYHFGHDTRTDAFHLKRHVVQELKNPKVEAPLVETYKYINKNRHTLFHTEQIMFITRILEDKLEADQIVNEVIDLIERTYTYLTA
ncbi:type II toxin-antitoxin system RnlA family toxin [Bacillus aquiflavi]|uniref:type II toxin-antitoxin system RnlA family toxin n=1 Tax=Bacillus aquiflavi TaxID=2672567 RepID=UPI001CA9B70D|nr:type II toxin-antitoxin system RnlA family toxin [Bacillus aquiflavi]UAC48679.1 type II toxin-antitoxin system RnlA family toxin [Bacillus aquiflavi]